MTDDEIRLFNEIMSGQEVTPTSLFEVPSIAKPDPNAEKLKQILEGREQLREKQRQEEFAARPLPEKIEGAREAAGFLGSTIGRGMTYPFVELYGQATDQPALGESYLEGAELPKTDLGLEYTIRTGEALEPLATAMDVAKIPHTPFTVELLPLANMPFALSKTNIARAGQKAAEDVRQATKAVTETGTKAIETVQETLATPPVGAISLDTLGFSSRLSEGVDKLQDKGTGAQFLAQLSKMKGVPQAEIKVTGLDEYLKSTPKVTKQEVQDYLETNRLQLIEDERIAGAGRLTERDLNALPKEFDWLDRYDLDEQFEDKAHLRNHLMVTLNRHFDDLEADAADTGGFYAKDSSGEVRYIPESKKFEWFESEQDRIDDVLSEFPDFNAKTNFSNDYLIPGGQNYREILYKLPDDKVEGVFLPPASHYTDAMNTFGTIRSTDRTIDGTPTLFAEEIQSDWAIAGAKRGYAIDKKAELPEGTRIFAPGEANIPGASWSSFTVRIPNSVHGRNLFYGTTREEAIANAQSFIAQPTRNPVPDNPFRGNWYKPVINNFLVKAAQEGKGGIGFPVGEIIKDRYNLANVVDRIESSTDRTVYPTPLRGGPFKTVTIDLKPALAGANEKQMSLRVDKDGLVRGVNADQYNRFIGKPLTEVVGKGVSEKILSNDSQVMTDLDLKIGGEGKDKLYDDMLPKHLNEIGKRYGVQLEKRTIPFGEGDRKESEVYFMPITEEMRNDILSQGLPMFKQGGHVKMAKGGPIKSALEGVGKAAAEVKKTGKLTRLQKELRERGGEKQAQRLERAADEIPGLERLFHSRGLIEAFQGSEGFPYQGVVTMRPGDYKNFSQPLEVDLSEGRQGISPYSVQNIEDLRELIRRGRPFTSVPYLQLDKKGPLTIVSGHEGRHRTRAMEAEDMPATLVQVLPRHSLKFKDLRNPSPSEWRQKLSEAMGPEGLVLPEGGMKLNPKFARASELAKKASEERDWNKFGAFDRELSRYHKEDKVKLPDLEMLTEFPEVYQKGGAVKSMVSGAQRAAKEGKKMLQGVYRGYTGERLEEPVLSTTPQRKVAEYYATRRAATRGEDPHIEMLMVDPFVGKEYGLALPIDEFNRELLTTRARAIAPSDVVERTQLKKKGGLACLSK
jgi:hypothetical protein